MSSGTSNARLGLPYHIVAFQCSGYFCNVVRFQLSIFIVLSGAQFYYRATRTHSADYAVARCLSVSVRHTLVFCLNGRMYPHFFHRRVAPPVFPYQTGWQYSDGTPPQRGRRMQGGMKNHDFRQISRFISKIMQDRAIVTMEGE